jgi:hypothetical protein
MSPRSNDRRRAGRVLLQNQLIKKIAVCKEKYKENEIQI